MEKRYNRNKPRHDVSRELWKEIATTTKRMETKLFVRQKKFRWHHTWYVRCVRSMISCSETPAQIPMRATPEELKFTNI
jgi:hypothetical protein